MGDLRQHPYDAFLRRVLLQVWPDIVALLARGESLAEVKDVALPPAQNP